MALETFILDGLKVLIVVVWGLVAYFLFRIAIGQRERLWHWPIWWLGVLSSYWSIYYIRSLVGIDIGPIHQIYVRGPLLITGGLLLSLAIIVLRRLK